MALPSSPCPRCSSNRLSVVYLDAEGRMIGGQRHCPDCGPRQAELVVPPAARAKARDRLLERKAS
ncbi:MAG: hypothetical protein NVSMB29_13670 [Candidatus Dormibacteria bacterium]